MRPLNIIQPTQHEVLRRITVSKVFWEYVHAELPRLNARRGYRELFWYLLFGTWHDRDTHRLLLPSELLCSFEGRNTQNSRAEAFLKRFREEVIPPDGELIWSGWDPRRGKCRQLIELNFGRLNWLVEAEYKKHWHHLGRVYLDGRSFSTATIRQARREELNEVQPLAAHCFEAECIKTYLNSLSPHLFTHCVTRNYAAAEQVALVLKDPVRSEQLRILRCIESQPQPFFRVMRGTRFACSQQMVFPICIEM